MATFAKNGYGQVEPNHLSAQRNGKIYAQLPAKSGISTLENGQFVHYDRVNGTVNFDTTAPNKEWYLVFNEVVVYGIGESNKDFVLSTAKAVDGKIYPRVLKTDIGDTYTTNMIKDGTAVKGNILVPGATGILEVKSSPATTDMQWAIVDDAATMPDGEPAVKIQRIN